MKQDVFNYISTLLTDSVELASKQTNEKNRWQVVAQAIAHVVGICNGAKLMEKGEGDVTS